MDKEAWVPAYRGCRYNDVKLGFCTNNNDQPNLCVISSNDCSSTEFIPPRSNGFTSPLECRLRNSTIFDAIGIELLGHALLH